MSIINLLWDKLKPSPGEGIVLLHWLEEIENNARALNSFTSSGGGSVTGLSAGNVEIDWSEGITLFNPDTGKKTVHINPYGDMLLGTNIDKPASTSMAVWSRSQTYNSEAVSAGDLMLGDNSTSKANMYWDVSTGQLKFRGGTTVQAYIDTDGSVVAGAGAVKINSSGISIYDGDASPNEIKFVDETEATTAFSIYMPSVIASPPGGSRTLNIESPGEADWDSHIKITAQAGNDDTASLTLKAWANLQAAEVPYIYLYSNTGAADPDDQYIKFVGKKFLFEGWTGATPIIVLEDDGSIRFRGTAGGGATGIYYEDSGGTDRVVFSFPGSNVVSLGNRASNGVVKLYANTSTAGSGGETLVGTIEDTQVQWEVDQIIENDNQLVFKGTSGGANGGIKFEDSGGTDRSALIFPGSNVTELGNRGSNGKVKIYANTATAGSAGNTLVITVEDNKVYIEDGIDLFTTGYEYSNYYTSSTIQGFASITTGHIFTKKVGDIAHVWFDLTGTSGGATPTVLNFLLPFATTGQHRTTTFIRGRDNGTWLYGWAQIAIGTTTRVDCYTTAAAAGWTATGNKAARGYICFHAA
jgi:hypothetical protein